LSYDVFNVLGKDEKYMKILVRKSEGKRPLDRWADNIRMDVKEIM
jgi:hypothetical protein